MNKEIEKIISNNCGMQDGAILTEYITNLQQENKQLKEIVNNLTTMTAHGDRKQIKNTAQYKLELAEQKIDKALDMLDLIIPELWNISNAMTYKIKEVRKILGDKENESS